MRNVSECDMLSVFRNMVSSGLIDKQTWDRISAVFWIRGMDIIFRQDEKFREYVNKEQFNDPNIAGNFPFAYLYHEHNVTRICSELIHSPLFLNLEFETNTIWYLSQLFLYSITKNVYNAFGVGFDGIKMMKQSRLLEV